MTSLLVRIKPKRRKRAGEGRPERSDFCRPPKPEGTFLTSMTHRLALTAIATASFVAHHASAVEPTMTQGGFTGLEITPNARLVDWGRLDLVYDHQIPGVARKPSGQNFVAGFGLLPNVEFSGRLATSNLSGNCFLNECGAIRDLSAAGKVAIGLDSANRFRLGAGFTDAGGNATFFRTVYGVLTYDAGPFEASAGYARRSATANNGTRSPLDGVFAAGAWQPVRWLRTQVEYSDGNAWAGVRLFAPSDWLPEGWAGHVGVNASLTGTNLTQRGWLSAGLSIPLYKVPQLARHVETPLPALSGTQLPLPAYEARTPSIGAALPPSASGRNAQAATTPTPGPLDDAHLVAVAEALRAKGLEDIDVGRLPDGSVAIRANNATYNWNTLDALGAALAAIADSLGDRASGYRLVLTQRQVPLVGVTGQTDCLRTWLVQDAPSCTAGELSTPGNMPLESLLAGAEWVARDVQPSWKTLRVALSPVLRTSVGTEVGALDYSAGVKVGFSQPLWKGASLDWRINKELTRTSDYGPGGIFSDRRIKDGTERLAFVQTARIPLERWFPTDRANAKWGLSGVTGQLTVGRIGDHFDGGLGAVRWEPGEGRHRVLLQGGVFHNADFGVLPGEPRTPRPLLASYRYNVSATRTYVEATAGQFMRNDRGVQLGLRQWFSDVSVGVYVRRTSFGGSSTARTFAGLELTVPIGPARDMQPRGFQVTGTPRFSQSVETLVGSLNALATGRGIVPPAPSLDEVHNSDRTSLVYFEDNMRRIRDAARQTYGSVPRAVP